ncbi:uncharacterized protein GGS22DRAFT_170914 [Annulohypoxylon maeteangense]|uniref:uncharacterized protein n=1 Tax=Annulohypoxylon maeteangense TaxID=1927788 RepID=UPI002008584E|nr:uncharacterized protein GGS22DRAFT_170914 [Annulohypoxylon maeteangense]KAI0881856.1 hypothetical protein GGS22DRAFT_170914 [Annulohypoxylon maeteangense]
MALTEHNNISIAQIVIYVPALFIAVWLSFKHGFGRSAGWLYLIIFSLARIIGAAMQLATISDPNNISLIIGAATLQNVGVSPLIMLQLGLLGRALASIRKSTTSFVTTQRLRLVQVLALVGLILAIVGGSQSYTSTGYKVSNLSQAGTGVTIAAYVLLVIATVAVAMQLSYIEEGEKRLVLAVGLSLPFILVRLAYSGESVFGNNPDFSPLTANVDIYLGMAVVMEMVVIVIVEAIGMTLHKIPSNTSAPVATGYRQPWQQREADHEMNERRGH